MSMIAAVAMRAAVVKSAAVAMRAAVANSVAVVMRAAVVKSTAVSLNPILDPIKSAIFNTNFTLINQFPRSQSLCGCDRRMKARSTITAERGSTATSNLRSNGPEIGAFDRALRYF